MNPPHLRGEIFGMRSIRKYHGTFAEIESCDVDLIRYIAGTITKYCEDDDFQDTLAWHLPPDDAGQGRLPILRERLDLIGKLTSSPG
jgi:hypothetical protein